MGKGFQFFTKKRVQTIFTRVKGALPADKWALIKADLSAVVFFDKYDN